MKLRPSITTKLTLVLLGFAALILIGLGALAYTNGRNALETATRSELLSKSEDEQAAINNWVDERLSGVVALANTPSLIGAMEKLAAAGPGSTEFIKAHDSLVADLAPRTGSAQPFLAFLILEPQSAEVIAASNPTEEGKFKETLPFFINGREGPFVQNVYFSTTLPGPAMTVSAPVHDTGGRLLGVLAGQLNLDELKDIVQSRTGLRQTDDAFLVNTSNLFVTSPRLFPDFGVLQKGIHSKAVTQCLAHDSGVISALDFRDVPSIVAYRWLPEREMCLIVKLDEAEAFASVQEFGQALLFVGGLVLLAAAVLAVALARTFTRPILALSQGAEQFGAGDLSVRLPETSGDELGALARAFNRMTAALSDKDARLRNYAAELEQRVEERTHALQASESELVALFAAMPDVILVLDAEGRYLKISPTAADLFSQPAQDVLGKSMNEVLPPDLRDKFLGWIRSALDNNQTVTGDYTVTLKGREFWFAASISPMSSPMGKDSVVWVARDVTERKHAEASLARQAEELRQSQTLLKLTESIAEIGSWRWDLLTQKLTWSDGMYPLFDVDPEGFDGNLEKVIASRIHPDDRAAVNQANNAVLVQGAPAPLEYRIVARDGSERWVWAEGKLIRNESAQAIALTGYALDITERKHAAVALEESRARVTGIINAALDAMISIDARQEIVLFNPAAEAMFECAAAAALGQPLERFLPERFRASHRRHIEHFDRTGTMSRAMGQLGTTYGLRTNGEEFPIEASISQIETADGKIYAVILRDITERQRAVQEILQLNTQLEQRVTARTAELTAANKELEAFSYSVSHDLRAPLRAIDGFSRILMEDYAAALVPEAQRYLDLVIRNTAQMGRLVDDLLAFSRLSRQPLNKKRVAVKSQIQQILQDLRSEYGDRRVEMTIGELPDCQADSNLLKQVWINLLTNAFKFTRKCDVTQIEIGYVSGSNALGNGSKGEPGHYFVRDNGVGFDMQYIEKLFTVFQRFHRAEEYEGTGVGLAIVARIIHRHGGRIWAKGAVDRGATFYFTLEGSTT